MITDIMSLARDVDRLFRARQDGRQMPVGERKPGFREPWVPCVAEWNAYLLGLGVDWCKPYGIDAATKTAFRTRAHVAMLALTEPEHFNACLAEVKVHRMGMDAGGGLARECDVLVHKDGTEVRHQRVEWASVRPARIAADVARTARYLIDLDARLTEWREAEAIRKAIMTREAEIAAEDALAEAAREPLDPEDEAAIGDGLNERGPFVDVAYPRF